MPSKVDIHDIFSHRLKQAREAAELSQKDLGILAGLDQFVASTRINRYEKGVHEPDMRTAARLAKALKVPASFLYAIDEPLAQMILAFSRLSSDDQLAFLRKIEKLR
jgi:transcriptional regulator with XRE-family HTH domain